MHHSIPAMTPAELAELTACHVKIEDEFTVAPSAIHGLGTFATKSYGVADPVLFYREPIIHDRDYHRIRQHNEILDENAAIHFAGEYHSYAPSLKTIDFVNHSDDPNTLYHLGVCFAMKPIAPGDEITMDYRLIMTADDFVMLGDRRLDGMHPLESLRYAASLLSELAAFRLEASRPLASASA